MKTQNDKNVRMENKNQNCNSFSTLSIVQIRKAKSEKSIYQSEEQQKMNLLEQMVNCKLNRRHL